MVQQKIHTSMDNLVWQTWKSNYSYPVIDNMAQLILLNVENI